MSIGICIFLDLLNHFSFLLSNCIHSQNQRNKYHNFANMCVVYLFELEKIHKVSWCRIWLYTNIWSHWYRNWEILVSVVFYVWFQFQLFVFAVAIQLIGQHIRDILIRDPTTSEAPIRQRITLQTALSEPGFSIKERRVRHLSDLDFHQMRPH